MKFNSILRKRTTRRALGGVATLALAAAGLALVFPARGLEASPGTAPLNPGGIYSTADLSTAFQRVAESIHPSVVSIKSVNRIQLGSGMRGIPFRGFPFGDLQQQDPFGQGVPEIPEHGLVQQGLGTGVVISEDGYILTNNHVIKDAEEVTVTLADDSEHEATVVGTDPKTDLAVLHIDGGHLVPAPLGDDSELHVGNWVAAVGNPFGLSSTITAGIVSAVGRSRVGLADYEDFIQTDAAINPGNSGGPLVNLSGEVVGINTAIFTRNGGYMGIGFAIPIDLARSVFDSLIEDGHVERGYLGVMIQNLDEGLAASFDHQGTDGALVSEVTDDGPAEKAGLKPGDIIVKVDGKHVHNIDTLRLQVANTRPGTKIPIEFLRDGDRIERDVEIGELANDTPTVARHTDAKRLGMDLETLTPRLASRLDLERDQEGVLVTAVEPLGRAARAGIRPNDVVLTVQGAEVHSVAEFEAALDKDGTDGGVRLTVLSDGARRFAFLRTEK